MKTNQPRAIGLNDLGQLTLRANVAFAVRCAQRIRPCFKLPLEAPRRQEQIDAVDRAIRVAEAFCQGQPEMPGRAAEAVRQAAIVAEETCDATRFSGYAAVRAAQAAAHAENVVHNKNDSSVIEVVAAAFGAGRVLAANADAFSLDRIVAALYADLEKLIELCKGSCEDLGIPVDPSEAGPLGPLWPDGAPAWCKA